MLEEEICTSCNMYTYLVVKWRRMMFISKMLKELPVHSDYVFFFFFFFLYTLNVLQMSFFSQ